MRRAGVSTTTTARAASPAIWAALVAVYVVWGATYLAIRVVNRTLPPLLAASARFLVAGALMYAWTIRRGNSDGDRPTIRQWRSATIIGGLLLLGGNGGVVWAEKTIPSGIAALLVALVPLWMATFDRAFFGRRVGTRTVVGLVAGFGGAALLVDVSASRHVDVVGMLFVVGASLCWASGSLYSRHAHLPARPFVGIGMEMLAGGVLLGLAGIATGELGRLDVSGFSRASLIGLAYLIVFGSWVGFASYLWLLRNARTTLVSTYAFVNPVVAVFLGWLLIDEQVGLRTVFSGAIVLASVALIITSREVPPSPDVTSGAEISEELGDGVEGEVALEGVRDPKQHRLAEHRRRELEPDG